jgi:hypothetical protein
MIEPQTLSAPVESAIPWAVGDLLPGLRWVQSTWLVVETLIEELGNVPPDKLLAHELFATLQSCQNQSHRRLPRDVARLLQSASRGEQAMMLDQMNNILWSLDQNWHAAERMMIMLGLLPEAKGWA